VLIKIWDQKVPLVCRSTKVNRIGVCDLPLILWVGPSTPPLTSCWRAIPTDNIFDALDLLHHSSAAFRPHVIVVEWPLPAPADICSLSGEDLGGEEWNDDPDPGQDRRKELLDALRRASTGIPIIMTGKDLTLSEAVSLMRTGAHDVVLNRGQDVEGAIDRALQWNHVRSDEANARQEPWRRLLVGSSAALERTLEVVRLVGGRRSTVLITGETGSGKEMVARALHLAGPRGAMPLVAVNCNALPDNLLEAELFGHVKGAFTGAIQQRIGRFEQAHKGTLFLDEVGDLPLDIQTKLLRVLQEREFQRIGSSETLRVDVRIIAATNVNLLEKVQRREFREDLYYRLNVVPVSMPPLRERLEDIPVLASHFVEKICRLEGIPARRLAPETIDRLMSYSWPGNVRQLENVVEMAVALSGDRDLLHPSDFPLSGDLKPPSRVNPDRLFNVPAEGFDFEATVGRIERQILCEALRRTNGNKTAAAEMLGLKRTTLSAKLKTLDAVAG
jgi:DNA-binding NtrC family response regulator